MLSWHLHCTVTFTVLFMVAVGNGPRLLVLDNMMVAAQVYIPVAFHWMFMILSNRLLLTRTPSGLNHFTLATGLELDVSQYNSSVSPSLRVVIPVINGDLTTIIIHKLSHHRRTILCIVWLTGQGHQYWVSSIESNTPAMNTLRTF